MPLYMDIHNKVDGLTADAVKHAHEADLQTQDKYGVEYLQYWFDEGSGKVFCLVNAPDPESAARVHREAHGLEADEIVEVRQGVNT
jgi:Protein of unknown function (DUF4242)